jgi:endoglucanase
LALLGALACAANGETSAGTGGASGKGGASSGQGAGGSSGAGAGGAVSSANGGAANGAGSSSLGGSHGNGGAGAGSASGGNAAGGSSTGNGGSTSAGGASAGGASAGGASASGGNRASGGAANVGGATSGAAGSSSDSVDAATLAPAMGFGTNIGNTLENTTAWETGWGQPLITQAYINGMKSHGIKTVRVPVAWNTYASGGAIDPAKLNRVKEVVGWLDAAGMYSIVNIHWDGGWIFNEPNSNKYKLTDDVKTKFTSYWTQIAAAFGATGHKLIFEALNEEGKFYVDGDSSKAPDYAPLNQLNQLFVTTVRGQSGYNKSRALLIAGFNTDIDLTCVDAFSVPNDPAGAGRLFLSIHYYTPYTFCGLDTVESWGSPATTWGSDAEKATLQDLFTKLASFSAKKKLPVILGEFGVTRGEKYPREAASRILWMESVAKAALSRGIVPVLWDTGSEIKRSDGSLSTELQTVMTHIGLAP